MDEVAMAKFITDGFSGVETSSNFGYTFFFYGQDRLLPFATMSSSDYEHDQYSHLDRPGVYRLNLGVSAVTFQNLFGSQKVDVSSFDFKTLNTIMPHPEYAAQHFACVLNPSGPTLDQVKVLLTEAHGLAVRRQEKHQK